MSTPEPDLHTSFVLDSRGRMLSTREPLPKPPPAFTMIRGETSCVWAVSADLSDALAAELDTLAREEPPASDLRAPPLHAERYTSLLGGRMASGPNFIVPDDLPDLGDCAFIDDIQPLRRHLRGWVPEEIPGRWPIVAVLEHGRAVSVCCSARLSDAAAEAGLETAEPFRGRGLGPRVTVAWASAVRESGRQPLYSTSWDNEASLSVARKLGLQAYASSWRVSVPS